MKPAFQCGWLDSMDVVCGRCRAEYEFDDALISERGTTVRCTSCGLQFKVFPPAGLRAPEIWSVSDPAERHAAPRQYDSLRDLQKAIARGEVVATHLLARGDEAPRALADIVELQPLLRQPRSDRPPPDSQGSPTHQTPVGDAPGRSGEDELDVQAVVPAIDDERKASLKAAAPPPSVSRESKPRIRSALSINAAPPDARITPTPQTPREAGTTSIAPPRVSLRSTLASSFPTASQAGVPLSRNLVPDEGPAELSPEAFEDAPNSPRAEHPMPPPLPAAATSVAAPVNPKISEAHDFRGQLTPTPGAMRAIREVDSTPESAALGVPVKRGARSGAIVLSVLIGAGAFLGFANRDRIAELLNSSERADSQTTAPKSQLSQKTREGLLAVDIAWVMEHLLAVPREEVPQVPPEKQGQLFKELEQAGRGESWMKVNLLRAAGKLKEARALSGKLPQEGESAYALSLLDLVESPDAPPWPVILERMREAAVGEGPPFLARTVYVYALGKSGDVAQARVELRAFSQMSGASESQLFSSLKQMFEKAGLVDGDLNIPGESASVEAEAEGEVAADAPASGDSRPPEEKSPSEGENGAAEEAEKRKPIPAGIQEKVSQADALWRGGNRDGALTLYRQVVKAIGTRHFLGQRSAARIRQAELEKAETP